MKPVNFQLEKPDTLDQAIRCLSGKDSDAKLMGGGQSLGPMLNLRLARPEKIVKVTTIDDLRGVQEFDDHIEFGAALTHAEFEDGTLPAPIAGMMQYVASGIAYRAVRNRGTIGGSICHADPAADWVSALTALDASIRIKSSDGSERVAPFVGFMHGAYRVDLEPDEIVTAVIVPCYSAGSVWGYYKICRKVGEFADAIAVWVADPEKRYSRVVFGSTAGAPVISEALSTVLAQSGQVPDADIVKEELSQLVPDLDRVKLQMLAVSLQRCANQALNNE